jgi:hypothetical protein
MESGVDNPLHETTIALAKLTRELMVKLRYDAMVARTRRPP